MSAKQQQLFASVDDVLTATALSSDGLNASSEVKAQTVASAVVSTRSTRVPTERDAVEALTAIAFMVGSPLVRSKGCAAEGGAHNVKEGDAAEVVHVGQDEVGVQCVLRLLGGGVNAVRVAAMLQSRR
eukprot:CAMPEP_0176438044 /NCGR_PEP_ID=MMETSP0127-20121128/19025_1 /TAXON_ID=938130 /ORGANISM="Platyophrya macrostoma, Strain WH" /LENGTH=127 /DNA_ID=CAMNT_0017821871 /DNA_START=106 /DNA_END=492 /DNA_ORIENTATION=+